MKTVFLVRHAKSDWADPSLSDFERPLNHRGKRDAPVMAQRLLERKINVDVFISSPAKRAARTAKIFAETFDYKKGNIDFKEKLYLAEPEIFLSVITDIGNDFDSVAIFSHNPGITDFANQLTDARIDNIPTCGIFAVAAKCDKWKDFESAEKKFLFFDYPKASAD